MHELTHIQACTHTHTDTHTSHLFGEGPYPYTYKVIITPPYKHDY